MNTSAFESKVLVSAYASVSKDLIPDGGLLSVDEQGVLTLKRGEDNEILIQKPLKELKSVQFGNWEFFRSRNLQDSMRIYVGPNEAYAVTFAPSDNTAYEAAVSARRSLFKGELKSLRENMQQQIEGREKSKVAFSSDVSEIMDNREKFIKLAQDAGIYHQYNKTIRNVTYLVIAAIIIFAWVYVI